LGCHAIVAEAVHIRRKVCPGCRRYSASFKYAEYGSGMTVYLQLVACV